MSSIYRGHGITQTPFAMYEAYGEDRFHKFDTLEGCHEFIDELEDNDMKITKQPEQEIQYDDEGEPFVMWGKTKKVMLTAFYKESVRFIDPQREYWHGLDCLSDLVIHLSNCGTFAVLGKVRED